ncbi:MAG: hypothetical protein P4L84_22095 [Isosphaeraceae bacterium]|nr:hypothetical protein [Isosphaeraceae bacterium]
MRMALSLASLVLALSAPLTRADEGAGSSKKPSAPASDKPASENSSDREKAALAFVRDNHPELAQLLEQLKPMKPADYNRAVRDIYSVSKTLAGLKEHDPKRYEVGLELWKARSRVELLTAKLIRSPSLELEAKLHEAVSAQVDVEIRQQKLEREQAEARLKKVNANIDRLESNQSRIIENRFQTLLKQSQRNRRQDADKPAPVHAKKEERKG